MSQGTNGVGGPAIKTWPEMRLPKENPNYQAVGGAGEQTCKGDLIRCAHAYRNLQRHSQSSDGVNRNAVRAQRGI